jgi:hypothetical protein
MPLFLFIFIFLRYTYIHLITFIQYICPSPFAEVSLHLFIALKLSGKEPPCGAEPRIELGLALQQADALSTEQRRTIPSNAAPYRATPHHTEQRRTIPSNASPLPSNAAPYRATPHHAEQRRTIPSNAAPFRATPHHRFEA